MIGVWMTPCKNGQCELSVRRDGINKIVIASQTSLTDEQVEELFWCIGAMQKSGKTLRDLLKEQEEKTGEWIYKHDNLWYCSRCGEIIYSETDDDLEIHHAYCSRCGAKMKQEGR